MAKYRSSSTALAKTFEHASSLIYLVAHDWTIRYANPACAMWLGVEADQLFGSPLLYTSQASGEEFLDRINSLAPPPERLVPSPSPAAPEPLLLASPPSAETGQVRYRWAAAYPIIDCEDDEASLIVISQPEDLPSKPDPIDSDATPSQLHAALSDVRRESRLANRIESLVGVSPFSARLRRQAALAAGGNVELYLWGPAGSGQEHIARSIFNANQGWRVADLLPLDSATADVAAIKSIVNELQRPLTLPPGEPRATTNESATTARAGLLLLNVDRLNQVGQLELYRLLTTTKPTFRIISTGEQDLTRLAKAGTFHEELAAYLCPMKIELLPLWRRTEDIPLLAQSILERRPREQTVGGFDAAAIQLFCEYRWPGNLEQLVSVVAHAGLDAHNRLLTPDDLPQKFRDWLQAQRLSPAAETTLDLTRYLESIEQELILRAIGEAKGNKTKAARLLGLSRAKLLRRIDYFGLAEAVGTLVPATSADASQFGRIEESQTALPPTESEQELRPSPRHSKLRDKLRSRPAPEELVPPPDELDQPFDDDWVTPDAFEEVD